MAQTVIGMFESSSKAEEAVQELVEAGFTRDRIDVSRSNSSGSSYSSGSGSSYSSTGTSSSDDQESGISKFFKSLFGNDDDDADKYSRVASQAQSIVTVHAQSRDEAERAADILDDNGAVDVDEQATRMGYGSTGSYAGSGTDTAGLGAAGLGAAAGVTGVGSTGDTGYTDTNRTNYENTGTTGYSGSDLRDDTTDATRKIPIIEENIEVGKREVKTGGVRLRSRIVERPVEESIRLREERVSVERNTVDRPATDADFSNFQERDIEMVERAEVPVVNKEARVVEEVSLGKDVEERTETIQDTVRRTEVDVEDLEKNDLTRNNRSGNSDL